MTSLSAVRSAMAKRSGASWGIEMSQAELLLCALVTGGAWLAADLNARARGAWRHVFGAAIFGAGFLAGVVLTIAAMLRGLT
jgi:hypothetical protein